MNTTLLQFPISHFCEKARWALDYKGLAYRKQNLLPGLHLRTTRKLAPHSHVPILVHGGRVVQGSSAIITHLDGRIPDRPLSAPDPVEAQREGEWEAYLDEEVGVHLRRFLYHTLLDHPDMVIGFFTQDGPWWGKAFYRLTFPRVRTAMRKHMRIDAQGAAESRLRFDGAMQRLGGSIGVDRPFLVGRQFSRADLTAAALLAPLFMPPQYGLTWPSELPGPISELIGQYPSQLRWAEGIYQRYREVG